MPDLSPFIKKCRVKPGEKVRLTDYDPAWSGDGGGDEDARKKFAEEVLAEGTAKLEQAQDVLYASDTWSVLVVLQALDAAGKDSLIKHVMSGVNPQGCEVHGFKQPSAEELDHDFLWRYAKALPERGRIGIFNRSHYEEVLVVKVHDKLLEAEKLPVRKAGKAFWKERYEDINAFERHLARNGTLVLKFFLHVSKQEQRRRFLKRLDDPHKHWKFSANDLAERAYWDDYQRAYEDALSATSTEWAPWYIIPADHKWVTRALVATILAQAVEGLDLKYPEVTDELRARIAEARKRLEGE